MIPKLRFSNMLRIDLIIQGFRPNEKIIIENKELLKNMWLSNQVP